MEEDDWNVAANKRYLLAFHIQNISFDTDTCHPYLPRPTEREGRYSVTHLFLA
jgi:hypothetical protein